MKTVWAAIAAVLILSATGGILAAITASGEYVQTGNPPIALENITGESGYRGSTDDDASGTTHDVGARYGFKLGTGTCEDAVDDEETDHLLKFRFVWTAGSPTDLQISAATHLTDQAAVHNTAPWNDPPHTWAASCTIELDEAYEGQGAGGGGWSTNKKVVTHSFSGETAQPDGVTYNSASTGYGNESTPSKMIRLS